MTQRVALLAAAVLAAPFLVVLTAGPSSSLASSATGLPACPPTQLTRTGSQTTAVEGAATPRTDDPCGRDELLHVVGHHPGPIPPGERGQLLRDPLWRDVTVYEPSC